MRRHVEYWKGLAEECAAVVFGPVQDPTGSWGLVVVEAETAEDVRALGLGDPGLGDPAVVSGVATFEVCSMPVAILRSS